MHCDKCYGAFTSTSCWPTLTRGLRGINLARAQSSLQEKVPFVNRRCFNHRTESARRLRNPNTTRKMLLSAGRAGCINIICCRGLVATKSCER